MNAFDRYREQWTGPVNRALETALPGAEVEPAVLSEAMRYTVFAGGKRLRPLLCLMSARAAGGREEEAMAPACAVEMVHAFSLIHDDLPAMDDDDLRRGRPTNHKVFGEGIAVLAGDGLLNLAFGTVAGMPRREAVADAVRDLAEAVGGLGLVGGQVLDLTSEGRAPDLETVETIHARKTAALFKGACRLGVLAVGGSAETYERLSDYAELLGLAFQIVDDVLDETGGDGNLGKTPGKDREEGKMTYPAAVGVAASIERARRLVDEATERIVGLPGEDVLAGLSALVVKRTH